MKNKLTLLLLVSLISCFLMIECSDNSSNNNTTTNTQADVIIPLAIGNSWVYNVYGYDSLGKETSNFNITLTVNADSTINNQKWYKYIDDSTFTINTANGYYAGYYDSTGFKQFLAYKYPVVAGDTFTVYAPTGSFVLKVDSVNASVTVPAGTFTCIKYSRNANFGSLKRYMYCAPKVGIIKTEAWTNPISTTPIIQSKMELQSYTLK